MSKHLFWLSIGACPCPMQAFEALVDSLLCSSTCESHTVGRCCCYCRWYRAFVDEETAVPPHYTTERFVCSRLLSWLSKLALAVFVLHGYKQPGSNRSLCRSVFPPPTAKSVVHIWLCDGLTVCTNALEQNLSMGGCSHHTIPMLVFYMLVGCAEPVCVSWCTQIPGSCCCMVRNSSVTHPFDTSLCTPILREQEGIHTLALMHASFVVWNRDGSRSGM